MKISLICILTAVLFAAASCSASTGESSAELFGNIGGAAILTGECGGTALTLRVDCSGGESDVDDSGTKDDGVVRITVLEPEALAGTVLSIGPDGTSVTTGEVSITLSGGAAEGIVPLAEAMRICSDDIVSAETDHVSARRGGTDYYVTLDEEGNAVRISWNGGDFALSPAAD